MKICPVSDIVALVDDDAADLEGSQMSGVLIRLTRADEARGYLAMARCATTIQARTKWLSDHRRAMGDHVKEPLGGGGSGPAEGTPRHPSHT